MKSLIITTLLTAFSVMNVLSQDISGVWHGIATNPDNKEITFVFLFERNGGAYNTTMAVPNFDISGIKPKATTFKNGALNIDGSNVGMKYEGKLNETTQLIEDEYTEGGTKLILNLKKGNPKSAALSRPQVPEKLYLYFEEEVIFENPRAILVQAATITRPIGREKFPVVI
ncbi:hypothetical protein [Belliella aquatica]|uniref:Lipocalin-like domain-containing protein n=1 Tax=Belliella aquatica TaxID=1323734 RepID=A0ABQ1N6Z9_9BACT|nr:hypothetical protein [Belliella aquatica]MCH7407126.1 DUF687 domain-containing protein [Belliella aquatica]GGC51938.1 hypothetical protein GCM10010993_33040 [Belliella aquatica]